MLNLEAVLPGISKFNRMKILGSGHSITKYSIGDIYEPTAFYVVINHFDILPDLDRITDAPILFFAHDYHNSKFDPAIAKDGLRPFLWKDNVHVFLSQKDINHENRWTVVNYPPERLGWVKNLHFYDKAQSNLKYFENTENSLLGFSSTLHSPLSLVIGSGFITELHLYGLDLYIYQKLKRFDNASTRTDAAIIFNANKFLLNYINDKRPNLKIAFFN
jgi:hypothetical protein